MFLLLLLLLLGCEIVRRASCLKLKSFILYFEVRWCVPSAFFTVVYVPGLRAAVDTWLQNFQIQRPAYPRKKAIPVCVGFGTVCTHCTGKKRRFPITLRTKKDTVQTVQDSSWQLSMRNRSGGEEQRGSSFSFGFSKNGRTRTFFDFFPVEGRLFTYCTE